MAPMLYSGGFLDADSFFMDVPASQLDLRGSDASKQYCLTMLKIEFEFSPTEKLTYVKQDISSTKVRFVFTPVAFNPGVKVETMEIKVTLFEGNPYTIPHHICVNKGIFWWTT